MWHWVLFLKPAFCSSKSKRTCGKKYSTVSDTATEIQCIASHVNILCPSHICLSIFYLSTKSSLTRPHPPLPSSLSTTFPRTRHPPSPRIKPPECRMSADLLSSAFASFVGQRRASSSYTTGMSPPPPPPPPAKRQRYNDDTSSPNGGLLSPVSVLPLSLNLPAPPSHHMLPMGHHRPVFTPPVFTPPVPSSVASPSHSHSHSRSHSHSLLTPIAVAAPTTETGGGKRVQCTHCGGVYGSADELREHKREHGRPFACRAANCTASFSKMNHLSRHKRIVHNKERPFGCEVNGCGMRFGSKSHLGDHTRAVHMRLRNFKCGLCDASWSKRFNLEKHIRIRHLGEKPFRCPVCAMSFGTRSHVTRHQLKVHKVGGNSWGQWIYVLIGCLFYFYFSILFFSVLFCLL